MFVPASGKVSNKSLGSMVCYPDILQCVVRELTDIAARQMQEPLTPPSSSRLLQHRLELENAHEREENGFHPSSSFDVARKSSSTIMRVVSEKNEKSRDELCKREQR